MLAKIELYFIIGLIGLLGFYIASDRIKTNHIEKLENKINYQDNNYGKGESLLKEEIKKRDSLLQANNIKGKNVEKIITVEYRRIDTIRKEVIYRKDTSTCIDLNEKGVTVEGCDGTYIIKQDFNATGILHRKPTKKFLFIKYKKKPVLDAWTQWGDSLNIKLVEK